MRRVPMEKQHHLNIAMLHHLPGILNLMQVVNLMMYGFVISQPIFFVLAMSNLPKPAGLSPKKWLNKLWFNLSSHKQILNCIILAISVLLFLFLNSSTNNALFIAAIFIVVALVNRLLPTQKNNMPANQTLHHWL